MPIPKLTLSATPRAAYGENDELEVNIQVQGRLLSGSIAVFDDHRRLEELEKGLQGFPARAGDERSFQLGIFNRLNLRLSSAANGKVTAFVNLSVHGMGEQGYVESFDVTVPCDPSALDSFCESLRAFEPDLQCEAELIGRADA